MRRFNAVRDRMQQQREAERLAEIEHGVRAVTRASVADVLSGRRHPHELPPLLWDLWRSAFAEGRDRAQRRVEEAQRQADFWHFRACNPAEVVRESEARLEAFRVTLARAAQRDRWRELDRLAAEEAARMRGAS